MRYEELTECPRCGVSHPVNAPILIACSVYCPDCAREPIWSALDFLPERDWLAWVSEQALTVPRIAR